MSRDRHHHKVFYQPRRGKSVETIQAIAPQIETLIHIQGTKAAPVKNLAFCNLAFQHTTWLAPDRQGYVGTQGGIPYDSDPAPAAIVLQYANHITFERNMLQHLGGMGILLSTGTHDVVVNANVMTDIADNAVSIGIPIADTADRQDQVTDHRISNNYITQVGQDYYGSVGIFAGYASGLQISHNELADLPYTAISVGWGWSDADSSLRNNLIQSNHIHHVMNRLFDGGAIYTLSKQPGTVISQNYIHDLTPSPWVPEGPQRQWLSGIYLDQGSSFIRLQDNVIINVPTKITQQSVAPPAQNNQLINNDRDLLQVKARSGIEAADRDIKNRLIP
jgi:Right handed beta helix region